MGSVSHHPFSAVLVLAKDPLWVHGNEAQALHVWDLNAGSASLRLLSMLSGAHTCRLLSQDVSLWPASVLGRVTQGPCAEQQSATALSSSLVGQFHGSGVGRHDMTAQATAELGRPDCEIHNRGHQGAAHASSDGG